MPAYDKPPLTYEQQLDQLVARGMWVEKRKRALEILATVGYYRLSAFWETLRTESSPGAAPAFLPGVSFGQVYERYQFDSALRHLFLYAVNHIEVALRAGLVYHVSHRLRTGNWLTLLDIFTDPAGQARVVTKIERSLEGRKAEAFVKHYNRSYRTQTPIPPAWISLQLVTFDVLVSMYIGLRDGSLREEIANRYGLFRDVYGSWLRCMLEARNRSAHHMPVWNRAPYNQPTWPKKQAADIERWLWVSSWEIERGGVDSAFAAHQRKGMPRQALTFYTVLCCACYLMDRINPHHTFRKRLMSLASDYEASLLTEAGFPDNWLAEPLWRQAAVYSANHPLTR